MSSGTDNAVDSKRATRRVRRRLPLKRRDTWEIVNPQSREIWRRDLSVPRRAQTMAGVVAVAVAVIVSIQPVYHGAFQAVNVVQIQRREEQAK